MSWWRFDLKNVVLIGLGAGLGVAVMALCAEHQTAFLLAAQWLGWAVAAACLFALAALQFRRDLVPDYLSLCRGSFYERDGFCFAISLDRDDGMAMFTIMFQGRYLGPSIARIALRPEGSGLGTVSPIIECGPAGFGIAKFPVAIPVRHQGKTVTFEMGVETDYPQGKGREVRFRCGRAIRHNARFRSPTAVVHSLLHSLVGHFVVHSPAAIRLTLPIDVADYVPEEVVGHFEELWSLTKSDPLHYALEQ